MKAFNKEFGVAIDVNSISGFTFGGRKIPIVEILDILKKQGVLIYDSRKGEKPFLFDPSSKVMLIESKTEEAKEAIKKYYDTSKD